MLTPRYMQKKTKKNNRKIEKSDDQRGKHFRENTARGFVTQNENNRVF